MQRERGGDDRRLASAQRRRPIWREHVRSWRPTRGPTSKAVLIVATTANAIGRAGRPLRPKRNPFGRGLLPRGWSNNGTVDVATAEGVWVTPAAVRPGPGDLPHDATRRAPAGADVAVVRPARREGVLTKVDRQGVAAGDCSRVTASASRLAEQRPSVGEVVVSHLVYATAPTAMSYALAIPGEASARTPIAVLCMVGPPCGCALGSLRTGPPRGPEQPRMEEPAMIEGVRGLGRS